MLLRWVKRLTALSLVKLTPLYYHMTIGIWCYPTWPHTYTLCTMHGQNINSVLLCTICHNVCSCSLHLCLVAPYLHQPLPRSCESALYQCGLFHGESKWHLLSWSSILNFPGGWRSTPGSCWPSLSGHLVGSNPHLHHPHPGLDHTALIVQYGMCKAECRTSTAVV